MTLGKNTPIAILGGGIAGISTAIALRLRGFDVEVFERREEMGTMGAGLVCWPNACFVLERLGILEQVQAAGGLPSAMRRLDAAGNELGALDIHLLEELTGYPSVSVFRSDLHQILSARLEELGTQVQYGQAVRSIEGGAQTQVHFVDGTFIEPTLIIGAEGRMASPARAFALGDSPVYQGFVNWIGVFRGDEELFADMAVRDFWGVGLRFGIVPVAPNRAYWAAGASRAEITNTMPEERVSMLLEVFSEWPDEVQNMLAPLSATSQVHEVHVHDLNPAEVWHRDNVFLIGDAAHAALPTSGQGACQALEDAYHLGRLLNLEAPLDAFEKFTSVRKNKTRGINATGRHLANQIFSLDEGVCAARNDTARTTDYKAMARGMAQGWRAGLF